MRSGQTDLLFAPDRLRCTMMRLLTVPSRLDLTMSAVLETFSIALLHSTSMPKPAAR